VVKRAPYNDLAVKVAVNVAPATPPGADRVLRNGLSIAALREDN
jgi:hypothetical protein